jgi:hypothetical protein
MESGSDTNCDYSIAVFKIFEYIDWKENLKKLNVWNLIQEYARRGKKQKIVWSKFDKSNKRIAIKKALIAKRRG